MRCLFWDFFLPPDRRKESLFLGWKMAKEAHLQPWLGRWKGSVSEGTKPRAEPRQGVADSTQARSLGPAPSASLFRSGELEAVQAVFLLFPTTTDKCKYPCLAPIIPGKGAVTQLEGWTQKKTK